MENNDKIIEDLEKIIKRTDIEGLNPNRSKDLVKIDDISKINVLRNELGLEKVPDDVLWNESKIHDISRIEDLYLSAFLQKYKNYFQKISSNYLSILDNENFKYIYMDRKEKTSEKDAFDIICDFYNSIDENKGNIVYNMIKEKKIIRKEPTNKLGYEGRCVNINSEKYPYIVSDYHKNRLDLSSMLTLTHEFGHAIEYAYWKKRNNKRLYNNNNMLIEISSLFYENLFLEFVKSNYLFKQDYPNVIGFKYYNVASEARTCDNFFADTIDIGIGVLQYLEGSCIAKDNAIYLKYFDDLTTYHFKVDLTILYDMKYIIGEAFSLNLINQYNNDPEKFNRKYNDFLSCRALLSFDKAIDFWNFDKERFLNLTDAKPLIQEKIRTYNNYLYKKKM